MSFIKSVVLPFVAAAAVLFGVATVAKSADTFKPEVGQSYRISVLCPTTASIPEFLNAYKKGPGPDLYLAERALVSVGCQHVALQLAAEVGEILYVSQDYEGDWMIVFHPTHIRTRQLMSDVVVAWDIHRYDVEPDTSGQDVNDT